MFSINKKYIPYFLVAFFTIVTFLGSFFQTFIWNDEAFSLKIIEHSFFDIVRYTASDVHPPLYYFILKILTSLSFSNDPFVIILFARFTSNVAFIGLAFFFLRVFNDSLSLFSRCLSVIFIFGVPNILIYTTEIRMYSWGYFCVTAAFISAIQILNNINLTKNLILLSVFSACAAYTHYFAAIPVAAIYMYILIFFLIKKYYRTALKICISGFSALVLYSPWIAVVLNQVSKVKGDYWIPPMNIQAIWEIIKYPLFNENSDGNIANLIAIGLILLIICSLFLLLKKQYFKPEILLGFFVLLFVMSVGITVSILMKPIFIPRYLVSSLGVFWLSIIFTFDKASNLIKSIVIILALSVSLVSSLIFLKNDYQRMLLFAPTKNYLRKIDNHKKIVTNSAHLSSCLSFYTKNENYVLLGYGNENSQTVSLFETVMDNNNLETDVGKILEMNSLKNILFIWKEDLPVNNESSLNKLKEELSNYQLELVDKKSYNDPKNGVWTIYSVDSVEH